VRGAFWRWAAGLAVLAAGGLTLYAQWPLWEHSRSLAVLNGLVTAGFLATAVLLSREGVQRGNALLFGLTGVFWTIAWLDTRHVGPLPALAVVAGPLFAVFAATALLRYPKPRLSRRDERCFVLLTAVWLVAGRTAKVVTSGPSWYGFGTSVWWPTLSRDRHVHAAAASVVSAGTAVLAVVFVVLLARRISRARGVDRRALTPVAVAAGAAAVAVGAEMLVRLLPQGGAAVADALTVEALALVAIPPAFLVAALRRRLARAAVADLVLCLARPCTIETVRDALRQALRDPSLDVLYWVPESNTHVDTNGRSTSLAAAAAGRLSVLVKTSEDRPLATVVVDPSLVRHCGLLDAAVTAGGLALENAQLQASVRAQLAQVRASQARIVEAGLAERRRLERDLHDSAQQRLLALNMQLAAAEARMQEPAARALIEQARGELHQALQELRDLARGIHPPVLSQAGLGAAIESVAERLPLAVDVDAAARRWEPAVEATAYFVVCEALANTVKHAKASRATVRVRSREDQLWVEVADDGGGGADPRAGHGLSGLRDRIAALGGEIVVASPPGAGTRITASIPCE